MKRWLLIAVAVAFGVCYAARAEESFGDLEGSTASKEFTPAERRYFTEALDRYQKYELSSDFKIRSIVAWLDNDHIIFSARKLPGWEARAYEHSYVISMNVSTGEYKDTGYRGRLMCLNHLGDLMIRQGGDEITPQSSMAKYEWLRGRWGEKLTQVDKKPHTFIPSYLCDFAPYGDPIYTTPAEKITPDMHRKLPLLPEHGYFKETVEFTDHKEIHPVYFFSPDGSVNFASNKVPSHSSFTFHPWMNAYFERLPLGYEPRIFHPSSGFSSISIPKLLAYWSDNHPAMVATGAPTKAGILWDVHQDFGFWKKQGLYLASAKGLLRVDTGRGTNAIVSPDGCKVLDTVIRHDPFSKTPNKQIWLVIDLCKEKK